MDDSAREYVRKRPIPTSSPSQNETATFNEAVHSLLAPKRGRVKGNASGYGNLCDEESPPAPMTTNTTNGFQPVSYSKNSKQGLSLVIRPTNGNLLSGDPKLLHAEIMQAAGETRTKRAIKNNGVSTVGVRCEAATNRLLVTIALKGTEVPPAITAAHLGNQRSIRSISSGTVAKREIVATLFSTLHTGPRTITSAAYNFPAEKAETDFPRSN